MKVFLAPTLALMAFSQPAIGTDPIQVDAFDKEKIQALHIAATELFERRNWLIFLTAERHNVNLENYDYDIEAGVFTPKVKPDEEITPDSIPDPDSSPSR